MSTLEEKRCLPCEGGIPPLTREAIDEFMKEYPAWNINADYTELQRQFDFKNYYHTMAFVNAVAWMAHQENHHPDLEVSYNKVTVRYSTHAVSGITENDFICVAKIEKILTL